MSSTATYIRAYVLAILIGVHVAMPARAQDWNLLTPGPSVGWISDLQAADGGVLFKAERGHFWYDPEKGISVWEASPGGGDHAGLFPGAGRSAFDLRYDGLWRWEAGTWERLLDGYFALSTNRHGLVYLTNPGAQDALVSEDNGSTWLPSDRLSFPWESVALPDGTSLLWSEGGLWHRSAYGDSTLVRPTDGHTTLGISENGAVWAVGDSIWHSAGDLSQWSSWARTEGFDSYTWYPLDTGLVSQVDGQTRIMHTDGSVSLLSGVPSGDNRLLGGFANVLVFSHLNPPWMSFWTEADGMTFYDPSLYLPFENVEQSVVFSDGSMAFLSDSLLWVRHPDEDWNRISSQVTRLIQMDGMTAWYSRLNTPNDFIHHLSVLGMTDDAGFTWNALEQRSSGLLMTAFLQLASGYLLRAESDGTVFESDNSGIGWRPVSNSVVAVGHMVESGDGAIIARTVQDEMLLSLDRARSWQSIPVGLKVTSGPATDASGNVWVGTGAGLMSWHPVRQQWRQDGPATGDVDILVSSMGGDMAVSANQGLFWRNGTASGWTVAEPPGNDILDMGFSPDGALVVYTSEGVFSAAGQSVAVEELGPGTTQDVLEVWPNPFQDLLNLSFEETRWARLMVYDVMGRELHVRQVSGGRISLDTSSFSAGHYYIRLVSSTGTSRAVVVKQ